MDTARPAVVSRRVALTNLGAGLGLALAARALGVVAQEATPTHSMEAMPPGAVGLKTVVLARIAPAAAPGQELQLVRVEVAPGATVAPHTHPGTIALCLESGAPVFGVAEGTVTMTRAATSATPAAAETLTAGAEIALRPGDCLTFEATDTVHTLRNPGGPAVIWQAHLYALGQPATTFVGTPTP
jgi:mannose-6-phosphate isomerase-like protein (cupin superfamily)